MAKKKLTRKELLKEPDEFLTLTEKLLNWIKQNPKPLVVGGCGLLLVILIVFGYIYYQNNRARVPAELLGQDLSRYQQLTGETDAEKALATVAPDFDRLIDKFGSQPAGKLGCPSG